MPLPGCPVDQGSILWTESKVREAGADLRSDLFSFGALLVEMLAASLAEAALGVYDSPFRAPARRDDGAGSAGPPSSFPLRLPSVYAHNLI